MQTQITRRRALQLPAAVAAALAFPLDTPTAPQPAAAQVPQQPPVPPIDREALGAWLAEYHRQEEALGERQHRAFAAIAERVGHDARKLADDLDVTAGLRSDLERDRLFMLVAAHVPGLAPALRLIYEHVLDISYGDEAGCCSEIAHLPSWIA